MRKMGVFLFSVSCLAMMATLYVDASVIKSFQDEPYFRVDKQDCSRFYIRRNGKEIQMKCQDNHVVNTNTRSCVPKGSSADTCLDVVQKPEGNCTKKSGRINHSENCAKYYDCSDVIPTSRQPKVKECPFPLLFDEKSQTCHHFSVVQCGARYEPKDACEYEENQCKSSHCIPCHVRFPSCKGLPNGLNPWAGREWTPYFVICQDQRLLFQSQCPLLSDNNPTVFHPVRNICVEMEIHY